MNFRERMAEDRRLAILRFLSEEPTYSLNDAVLQIALEHIGHAVSRDVVRTDFAWLKEQGLLGVDVVSEKIHVAKLTERGVDVAGGRAVVPGVKRPSPDA